MWTSVERIGLTRNIERLQFPGNGSPLDSFSAPPQRSLRLCGDIAEHPYTAETQRALRIAQRVETAPVQFSSWDDVAL